MKLLDRLASRLGYAKPIKRRSLDAGLATRLTQSWSGSTGSIDRDIYGTLERARNRSRDLAYNNDYMRKFLGLVRTNIVGPHGFALQVRATFPDKTPDKAGNDAVEAAFWRWSKRGTCEVSRKLSFVQLSQLIVQAVARDGEALIRKVAGKNDWGFQLQLIDIDRLEIGKNETLADGRVIKMGVELSPVGEPLAYHLKRKHPGDSVGYSENGTERVPAADVYHVGIFERPEQTRCLPWAVSAILRLEHLGAYEEAAVIASRYGAAKMAYWAQGEGDGASLADATDDTGQLFTDFEPGEIKVAPNGAELKTIDWNYPHDQYGSFVTATIRGIASGLGVSFATLSNDLTSVSYSSIRAGMLDERDNWMTLQGWFIESFLEPLYSDWLRMALLFGQVKTVNGGTITPDKYDKFNCAEWRGRRWPWVDPRNDMEASSMAIREGLRSRREIAAEQGRDLEEVFADLAAEQEMAKAMGVTLGDANGKAAAANAANG
ncbi:MAG: hypothetical protein QG586_586 [Pseudomonadota bacterium]|nr:hypothetical protein [Pseudomonadota bacterium]